MKILIVHAHENSESFSSALANQTKNLFIESGHEVLVSDLYKMQFNPVGSKADFTNLSGADYYKYASEQLHASANNSFNKELKSEMDKLIEADILNFIFPLWWFGFPAILKGWVDRVMAYGVAYGGDYGFRDKGRFAGKKAFLTITTGSPSSFYEIGGAHNRTMDDILRNMHEGILALVGYEVIDPFVAYGVSRISKEERDKILEEYGAYLERMVKSFVA